MSERAVRQPAGGPKFVTGSLLRHILVMTGAGALGLVAIFIGDLANMLFLSQLGDEAIIAAIGYASSILFFTISIGIGLSIAASALIAPAIGGRRLDEARRYSTNAHLATLAVSAVLAIVVLLAVPWLLDALGATGRSKAQAERYLTILVPALPPLAVAMTSAAVLRSVGDARRAMHVTLFLAIVNVILDPIFIFVLDLGIEGAAIASTIARLVAMAVGLGGVIRAHDLMARPNLADFVADLVPLTAIAAPAVITNIATPVANAYVTAAIAAYGDSAVAGWAVIGRIIPVAFGAIYALSGSIGPIIGQNFGAGDNARMRESLTKSLAVTAAFTIAAWVLLFSAAGALVRVFGLTGEAAALVIVFCRWLSPVFGFSGALFIANACFNTLGRPSIPAVLNWGRATVGTVPFAVAGGSVYGAAGVIAGYLAGGIVFGWLAAWLCYRHIDALREGAPNHGSVR